MPSPADDLNSTQTHFRKTEKVLNLISYNDAFGVFGAKRVCPCDQQLDTKGSPGNPKRFLITFNFEFFGAPRS
jgi:hypothetical protein